MAEPSQWLENTSGRFLLACGLACVPDHAPAVEKLLELPIQTLLVLDFIFVCTPPAVYILTSMNYCSSACYSASKE